MEPYIDYAAVKKNVEGEKEFRAEMDFMWHILTERLATLERLGEDMAGNIMINKPVLFGEEGGASPKRPNTPQTLAQLHPGGKAEIEDILAMIKPSRQNSIWKQKFYTYVYNRDEADAIKYHYKLHKFEMDNLESLHEDSENGKTLVAIIDKSQNDGDAETSNGEGAYLAIANDYKKFYELRKRILGILV